MHSSFQLKHVYLGPNFSVDQIVLLPSRFPQRLEHMMQDGEIAAETYLGNVTRRAGKISVEVRLPFAGDAQEVRKFMRIGRSIFARQQVAIDNEFAEEWPHRARHAHHRRKRCQQHGLLPRLLGEWSMDTHPFPHLGILLRNFLPHQCFVDLLNLDIRLVELRHIVVGKAHQDRNVIVRTRRRCTMIEVRLTIVQSPRPIEPHIEPHHHFQFHPKYVTLPLLVFHNGIYRIKQEDKNTYDVENATDAVRNLRRQGMQNLADNGINMLRIQVAPSRKELERHNQNKQYQQNLSSHLSLA